MRHHDSTPLETQDESYFASFTDMLVGIIFIFIILLMIVANNYQEATEAAINEKVEQMANIVVQEQQKAASDNEKALDNARNKELWKTQEDLFNRDREKILKQMEAALKQSGVFALADVKQGVLRLPENLFYAPNENTINERGKQALAILAYVMGSYLPCVTPTQVPERLTNCGALNLASKDGLDAIFIVDNPDFGGSAEQKWLLSVERAIGIFGEVTTRDPYLDRDLKNIAGVPVLNLAAKKERRMLKPDGSANASMGKTLELWFKMRSPTPDDIQRLRAATMLLQPAK